MAGAYTSLLSLTNTIDQIQNHSRHSFSFDEKQIRYWQGELRFLLEFVESQNSHGRRSKQVDDLEMEIVSAAFFFEHAVESFAVDQILAGSTLARGNSSSSSDRPSFFRNFQTKMEAAKKNVMKVPQKIRSVVGYRKLDLPFFDEISDKYSHYLEHKMEMLIYPIGKKIQKHQDENRVNDEQQTDSTAAAATASRPRPPATRKTAAATTVVGFDNYSIQLLDFLTAQQSSREIFSVVGMGGSGKTTLAKTVFSHQLIIEHFDIRAWATISQEYDEKEILLELLSRKGQSTIDTMHQLGEQLYKKLSGRRYLIVLDDMWSGKVWDKIRPFFPDYGNNSRILVTTRLSNVASYFTASSLRVDLLDEDTSWELFRAKAFREGEDCPLGLEKIGKEIVRKCKGLPLSIVVIAGYLRKSLPSISHWVYVANHIASVFSSGEDEGLSILSLSYTHLPLHLKPCFLYMGVFREDAKVRVSTLIRFWIAEGFLRPDGAKTLDEIAEDYLNDLVDRNLISIEKQGPNGQFSKCKIHDLLREVCLKVGGEERFFCALKHPAAASRRCRTSTSCKVCNMGSWRLGYDSRLFRILDRAKSFTLEEDEFDPDCVASMFEHYNMRYVHAYLSWHCKLDEQRSLSQIRSRLPYIRLPSSISLYWNLQSLVIGGILVRIQAPAEIWEMPQLRHVDVSDMIRLPDPPPSSRDGDGSVVMRNLLTLKVVEDFKTSAEVCKRIPNIKALEIYYSLDASTRTSSEYCQQNLGRFTKLEYLNLEFAEEKDWGDFARELAFPGSLKELLLRSSGLRWDDLSPIGSLPKLEALTVCGVDSVRGEEWGTVEGEFVRLKFLTIYGCEDLVCWKTEKTHFPVLETLTLGLAYKLAEFPSEVGDIPTLRRVHVDRCSVSAAISAVRMAAEQEELGNEDLRLEIELKDEEELESVKETLEEEGIESNNVRLKYYSFE